MVNSAILVFFGGALGAILRELVMLIVPRSPDTASAEYLGRQSRGCFSAWPHCSAAPSKRRFLKSVNMFAGTGICGGLSTFSSFAFGMAVLTKASTASAVVAVVYMVVSLVLGYIAVGFGLKVGGKNLP